MTKNESPISYNSTAFACDGEVDEANLLMPDDAVSVDAEALASIRETADALDELLNSPVREANDEGDAVATEQAEEDPLLDPLDELLAESLAPIKAKMELKNLRAQLARTVSARERLEIEAKVREWEARVEWDSQATVALFTRQACMSCCSVTATFSGLLTRQQHRVQKTSMRWVSTTAPDGKLPRETAYREQASPMCYLCAPTVHGFPTTFYPLIKD